MRTEKNHFPAFTLIELLVAIGVGLILVTSSIAMVVLTNRQISFGSDKLEAVQNNRASLDRFSRDLRQANYTVTALPYFDSGIVGASEIEFENGHDDDQINYLKYYLDNDNLIRQQHHYSFVVDPTQWVSWNSRDGNDIPADLVIDSQDIVANNISNLEFWFSATNVLYFDLTAFKNNQTSHMRSKVLGRNIQ